MAGADIADLVAKLDALRANAEQRPICPEYAYQAIRHINRNCDMCCALDHEDGSECVEWGRYDGPAVVTLWNNWAQLRAIVVAAQAYERAFAARRRYDEDGDFSPADYDAAFIRELHARDELFAAVRGEA